MVESIKAFKFLNKHLSSLGLMVKNPKITDWEYFPYQESYVFINKTVALRNNPIFMVKNDKIHVGYDVNRLGELYDEF